jgi:hypothetical protein
MLFGNPAGLNGFIAFITNIRKKFGSIRQLQDWLPTFLMLPV